MLALVELDTPAMASIRGPCMGRGMELALACSYRIAARSATFALPEVLRGAWPGTGGFMLLSRFVSPSLAKRLLYCGETLDAGAACDMGLVEEVVDDDALDSRVQALANCIANQPRPPNQWTG